MIIKLIRFCPFCSLLTKLNELLIEFFFNFHYKTRFSFKNAYATAKYNQERESRGRE